MSAKTQRRRTRRRPTPATPAQPLREPESRSEQSRREKRRDRAILLYLAGWAVLFFTGGAIAGGYVDLARWITSGSAWGMAVSGWLIMFAPFALIGALALTLHRPSGKKWAFPLFGMLLALIPVVLSLIPATESYELVELVSGAGGTDFIIGLRNGGLAGIVPLVVVPFVAANKRIREHHGADGVRRILVTPVVAFVAATLAAAVVLAGT